MGDEDEGLMGSLSALMAMGLFEERGGCAEKPVYEITTPIFDKIIIHLNNDYYKGKDFVIETKNNTPENVYIQSAMLNGMPLNKCWFYHRDIVNGGNLILDLGSTPNKEWGVAIPPPSMSDIK